MTVLEDKINLYLDAQENTYDNALAELKAGKKTSHWMWFIFPQIKGLGQSFDSYRYGLNSLEETKTFYNHPILGKRLKNLCNVLLNLNINDPEQIFGYTDALKLKSSMTIFYIATGEMIFKNVLAKYYDGQFDNKTIIILKENGHLK